MMQIEITINRKRVALATIVNRGEYYDCVMEYTTKDGEALQGGIRIPTEHHDRHTQSAVLLANKVLVHFLGADDRFCKLYAHSNPFPEDTP